MSKRGRRRNSKRRKSSSSSKQSVSPYIFQKQNKSNSVSYKDDIVEKGETDSLRKENALSGSEDEEKNNNAPPKEKRFKQDYHVNLFPDQRSIYTKTTEDKEKGVKTVTSVSVSDMEQSSPKITFQQSQEPLSENPTHSSTPITNIIKINCSGSHVQLEIQENVQLNSSDIKTTFVFMNEKGNCAETFFNSKERTWLPDNKTSQNVANQNTNYRFTFGSMSEQTESCMDSKSFRPTQMWDTPNYSQFCSNHKQQMSSDFMFENHPLLNIHPQGKRKYFHRSFSTDQFWDIPPPREFADAKYNALEDLTQDLASCRIGAHSPADIQQREFHPHPNTTYDEDRGCPFLVKAEERQDRSPSFDQLSESDNYEPLLITPSISTNRSSFTKDFINYHKRKSWIRNNSIATVERKPCLLPKKRRQTFPRMSEGQESIQEDFLLPYTESFSSLIMCAFPLQTENPGNIRQADDQFSAFGVGRSNSSQSKDGSKHVSENPHIRNRRQSLLRPLSMTSSEDNPDDTLTSTEQRRRHSCSRYLKQQDTDLKDHVYNVYKDIDNLDNDDCGYRVDQSEVADSGFDQEIGDVEYHSPDVHSGELSRRTLAIQVIPPSCSGSEEQMVQSHPVMLFPDNKVENTSREDSVSILANRRKSSGMEMTVGDLEQRFLQMDSSALDDPWMSPLHDMKAHSLNTNKTAEEVEPKLGEKMGSTSTSLSVLVEETKALQLDGEGRASDESNKSVTCPTEAFTDTDNQLSKTDKTDKLIVSRSSLDAVEHLKPVAHKDPDSSDHWAKRRKLFKESKQWSSAGGSSITSDITEESVAEDTHSMDMTFHDNKESRGFYTETFHSSAWIYQGDDAGSGDIPPSLNTRTRAVSIRERTVRINKGTGEYPWGFRIQFSKPIVVTEVDTNGAAEEAGLMVGDYVLAVNGTDVTSIPHSEAANLARQGPDILTLTIGSDIARGPNNPRPACRGYLHKRTQSGLIKGWRKRWFVLTHDCCLYYYRHKRDEGKRLALSAVKMEGAEVGPDVSLGKPFVFKCRPLSGTRVFFFCATSNQEMKRWLEAMEKAIHPITQNHVWVDVTRHNSNLPPLAVKNPECLGLLHKMDKSKDMWVQHYCILKDGCLSWYSGIRATHAQGGIYLQGYMVREQPYGSKKSTIELKPPSDEFKTFYFCAENPNENKRWIMAIKGSIMKWLPLHQALQDYMNRPPEATRM